MLVVGGGDDLTAATLAGLPSVDLVIAADSGVDRALAAGLSVDIAIGDFDSVTTRGLDVVRAAGAEIVPHRRDKNETDLELALLRAVAEGADAVTVVAVDGGRFDHLMAGVLLLADDRFASAEIDAVVGGSMVGVVRDQRTISGMRGDVLTLLAVGGPANGVVTVGLRYPLDGETLFPHSTRGVSNVFEATEVSIGLDTGVLLAIHTPVAS